MKQVKRAYPKAHEFDAGRGQTARTADLPDDSDQQRSPATYSDSASARSSAGAVWIVVYALLIAFLMWMRKRDGGGWGVP